ncbi:MAG: hypothetical protein KatS3mg102_2301 [Planctomycetota bacterium]|nr:MAG: hypothetical protein KatS3mg102_2301 [Planctomycetota bacterium]
MREVLRLLGDELTVSFGGRNASCSPVRGGEGRRGGLSPSCGRRGRLRDSDQVGGCRDEVGVQARPRDPSIPRSSQAADRLHPAADLFDLLSDSLREPVALVPARPPVDVGSPSRPLVPGEVRRDPGVAQLVDEGLGVLAALGRRRPRPEPVRPSPADHADRLLLPGVSVGLGDRDIDAEAMLVFHEDVSEKPELRFLPGPLSRQLGLRSRRRPVGLGGALLAAQADRRVAGSSGGGRAEGLASLGRKLLSEAQASTSVPSTVKWPVEMSRSSLARRTTPSKKGRSASSSRSLFLAKDQASQVSSTMFMSRVAEEEVAFEPLA